MTEKQTGKDSGPKSKNQGEGDREAAERYSESTKNFIDSGRVKEAAKKARQQDPAEAKRAEEEGKKRAKEEDPSVRRDYNRGG